MNGNDFIEKLREVFDFGSDKKLAEILNKTTANISQWRNYPELSPLIVARIVRDLAQKVEGETESL